jgi:hypothetical protein
MVWFTGSDFAQVVLAIAVLISIFVFLAVAIFVPIIASRVLTAARQHRIWTEFARYVRAIEFTAGGWSDHPERHDASYWRPILDGIDRYVRKNQVEPGELAEIVQKGLRMGWPTDRPEDLQAVRRIAEHFSGRSV